MIRIQGKTTWVPNPKVEGEYIKVRSYKINGLVETGLVLLGVYGGYKLIDYIFSKKKKDKDETE